MTTQDPTDVAQIAAEEQERRLQAQFKREQEDKDVQWLMSTKRGRRIVWRLLEQSALFAQEFRGDAMWLAFDAGRRHFGGQLLESIHTLCPELWPVMIKERKNDRHADGASE